MRKTSSDIRILPAVMGVGAILFALKAAGIAFEAQAAQTPSPAPAAAAPAAAPAIAPGAARPANTPATPAPNAAGTPPIGNEATAAIDAARARPRFDPNAIPSNADAALPMDLAGTGVTAAQMDVLTRLSDRRDALDERQREIEMQANILAATEKRVDQKITELKALEAQITKLLDQREANDAAQLDALVRVYSAMKPRDAARIFERLDGPVRIAVAGRMKPDVMAGLLASLPPDVAQKLTVELANRYRMADQIPAMRPSTDGAPAGAAPAASAPVAVTAPAQAAPQQSAADAGG